MDTYLDVEVTVLMPVFNAARHLRSAIESVLSQTYKNFEFLIINDGSTDDSVQIIGSFKDSRINLINFESNRGIVHCLNQGLKNAKGALIARMDADDVCDHKRLEKQVNFLMQNKDIAIVGCQIDLINDSHEVIGKKSYPLSHDEIKVESLFSCPLPHPGVLFRQEKFIKDSLYYDTRFQHAEDYELWQRVLMSLQTANLDEKLLSYRISEKQISMQNSLKQQQIADEVKQRYFTQIFSTYKKKDLKLLTFFFGSSFSKIEIEDFRKLINLLEELIAYNKINSLFNQDILQTRIISRMEEVIRFSISRHYPLLSIYRKSLLYGYSGRRFSFALTMYIKEWIK